MHTTTYLCGGWHVTFHASIASEFCDKSCDCCMPLFFICRSLEKVPWFWVLIASIELNFPFKMQLWEFAGEKTPKCFPVGSFFLVFLTKCLLKCPKPMKPPLPWKVSGWVHALSHYSFCKKLCLKFLAMFWIHLSQ